MDDLNFNVDDIINDVNAKIKSAEKNEADEESVEAEPIADTENSSEACEQADNTDEKPQETPEATDDKPEPILAFHEDKSEEDKSEEDEDKEPEKPEKQEKKPKSSKKKKKKRKKKTLTLSWKKATDANGYEVYQATKAKGKYKKIKTISKAKTTKLTVKKLKAKKTYYFKVRAYKKNGKQKLFGTYSKVLRVKM